MMQVWTGTPRIFLTLAVVYMAISCGFWANYYWNTIRYNYLGKYPYEGTDPVQFYYAKWYLRVVCYQNKTIALVFLALMAVSGLIYVLAQ